MRTILLGAAIAAALATSADARPRRAAPPSNVTQFCGDRYCPTGISGPVRIEITLRREKRPHRGVRKDRPVVVTDRPRLTAGQNFGDGGPSGGGGDDIVAEARRYLGGNPTGRSSLWCAAFMNLVLERTGRSGTGSNMASSFARYGTRVSGPVVGAIAVMSRGRRGGHVGIVSGVDGRGNPIVISGNHGRRVAESTYSRGRVYAYVLPR